MFHKKFNDLTIVEKRKFLAELNHAVQHDKNSFHEAKMILWVARRKGVFDKVKVYPELEKETV